ncbi:MAG: hypothetical protein HQ530_01775 [Parcubacteria group bacterium]|nr:hypothetical protein [Parcubacteria group bacterium]
MSKGDVAGAHHGEETDDTGKEHQGSKLDSLLDQAIDGLERFGDKLQGLSEEELTLLKAKIDETVSVVVNKIEKKTPGATRYLAERLRGDDKNEGKRSRPRKKLDETADVVLGRLTFLQRPRSEVVDLKKGASNSLNLWMD